MISSCNPRLKDTRIPLVLLRVWLGTNGLKKSFSGIGCWLSLFYFVPSQFYACMLAMLKALSGHKPLSDGSIQRLTMSCPLEAYRWGGLKTVELTVGDV